MLPRRPARWALLALTPLLVAVSDPAGDVAGCRGGTATGSPDLLEARGEILEEGTSARWTLTFAAPLAVPDREGGPFRVDVAIRDPEVPTLSFAYYRDVNRLVRVDTTSSRPVTQILLLPERGANVFNPPVVEGRTMTIQVPGRILSADEDLTGTSPGLDALRWTVVVRDERACDFLDAGRPTERMTAAEVSTPPEATPTPEPSSPRAEERDPSNLWPPILAGILVVLGVSGLVAYRVRR
jgi:hypothetical protein